MPIFPPQTSEEARAIREANRRAKIVEKWGPVMRRCRELEGRPREETERFALMCEEAYDECNAREDVSRFTRVILPNIRRLFGTPLPHGTPLLRTIEEDRDQTKQIIVMASGMGRRKLDLDQMIEPDYQI